MKGRPPRSEREEKVPPRWRGRLVDLVSDLDMPA